LNVE